MKSIQLKISLLKSYINFLKLQNQISKKSIKHSRLTYFFIWDRMKVQIYLEMRHYFNIVCLKMFKRERERERERERDRERIMRKKFTFISRIYHVKRCKKLSWGMIAWNARAPFQIRYCTHTHDKWTVWSRL